MRLTTPFASRNALTGRSGISVVSHRSSDQSKTTSSGPSTAIEAATVEATGGREDAVEVVSAGNEEGGVDTVEVVVGGASIAGGAAVLDEETEDGLSPPEHAASVSITITARTIRCICRYYSGKMPNERALGWAHPWVSLWGSSSRVPQAAEC
jgi:hypothetical protein